MMQSSMPTGDWTSRLNSVMPFGSSTVSKAPTLLPDEPAVIVRGQGCRVWDDRGREFIDFRNALGPVTLGYRFPAVEEAIRNQLESGITFGEPHPLECEVAEMLRDIIPCAEQVRFLKTGGEAIAACVKLARAYTGREHVVQIGYNGWLNTLAKNPPGVPASLSALHHACEWNDLAAIEKLFDEFHNQIAAVVVASDYRNMAAGATFYPALRELTNRHGTVLIFDEIVTGFRIAKADAQEYFNVTPDLAVYAKGMANGMPLSAYCGRREIMATAKHAIISSTYGGETLSLAAAKAAIETYLNCDVIGFFWKQGEKLWSAVNRLLAEKKIAAKVEGFWPCPQWVFNPTATQEKFFRACYRNGLSLYSTSYINFSHGDEDVAEALLRFSRASDEVRT